VFDTVVQSASVF